MSEGTETEVFNMKQKKLVYVGPIKDLTKFIKAMARLRKGAAA